VGASGEQTGNLFSSLYVSAYSGNWVKDWGREFDVDSRKERGKEGVRKEARHNAMVIW
jgi:hypothetical protein